MKALITGVAGFIGSQLAETLLARGDEVIGIDCFTNNYRSKLKRANLASLIREDRFKLVEADLRSCDLVPLLDGIETVFHLAAMPGVRASWASGFRDYVEHNILATGYLLEALRVSSTRRLIYASSSSVYGNSPSYPTAEKDRKRPHSPYGVTKLAAESLCDAYSDVYGIPVVSLRYFSVYGPRQRPDMGIHRIIESALRQTPFTLYGDGSQIRDMTYVSDVVKATIAASDIDLQSSIAVNIAGGAEVSLSEVLQMVMTLTGLEILIERASDQSGDVRRTGANTRMANNHLAWFPEVDFQTGLKMQIDWHQALLNI